MRVSGKAEMRCRVCLFWRQAQRTINDSALIVVENSAKLELRYI